MSEPLRIRVATPDDLDEIMQIAAMATDENGIDGFAPNNYKLLLDIWPALNQQSGLIGVIGEPGGIIEGGVLLRIGSLWYTDAPCLEEKCVFVHPDFRAAKGGRAKRLCEFSKWAADQLGMPLMIGVLSNERTQQKVRLYQRIFGEPAGAFFLYGSHTGQHAASH